MAIYAIGDLDPTYGTEPAVSPTVEIHLHTQKPAVYQVSCLDTLDFPPPYEEILKSTQVER